ncbi:MAG: T9SS type A sorting domain-containing protein [Roseivirga sp.]|nr:T9SS type A sorting domain-containing protein [Roseivirga sp.]
MKISRLAALFALLAFAFNTVFAQGLPIVERCHVSYQGNVSEFENWLAGKQSFNTNNQEVYRIPVVVHVLHTGEVYGEGAHLTKAQVEAQIRILNEDFRRRPGTKGFNTHPDGGDAQIEFVLANTAPDGSPTDGVIVKDISNLPAPPPEAGNLVMYGAHYSYWNPEKYLNIWSVPGIPQDVLLGFARFPESDLPGLEDEHETSWVLPGKGEIDGVAINAFHFGDRGLQSRYNLGRTATHEVGHFLGLFHTWGPNSNDQDGCSLDDFCQDTPTISDRTSGCPVGLISCDGRPVMIENYMDYSDDACMNIFTNDQISRMRTVLKHSPRRKTLYTSPVLENPLKSPTDLASLVKIYPNPASDKVHIFFEKHKLENVQITLTDLTGQTIFSKTFEQLFEESIEVTLPRTAERMILLQVETGKLSYRQKLLVR